MNILNVGPAELILILLIAIIVLGPEQMIKFARKIGQYARQVQSLTSEFTSTLQSEIGTQEEGPKPPPTKLDENLPPSSEGNRPSARAPRPGQPSQLEPSSSRSEDT